MSAYTARIKEELQQRQMSQRQLSRETGISAQYIANILVGRQEAGFVPAQKIERVLGVPLDLWYASRGKVPDDLVDRLGIEGLTMVFAQLRKG